MKKAITLIVGLFLLGQCTYAYDFFAVAPSGQKIYYEFVPGGVRVTYPGSSNYNPYYGYTSPTGNLTIPATVSYGGTTYSVTSIGDNAFSGCSGLTTITIPNSVASIGNWAFSNCSGLTSVTIGNSVTNIGDYAFSNCSGLTSVTIGNSVTSIDVGAFWGCSGLTSVIIPNSVTSIGDDAFENCSGLTSVTISEGVASLGTGAFSGCSGLTSVAIPNSVTSIGGYVFYNCSGLTSVTIPNSVTSIGDFAFGYCSGLTSVAIPNSVTNIGNYAFDSCSGLTSVTIPNSVTNIGNEAFRYCNGLTTIVVETGNTHYDSRDNCNAIIQTDLNQLIIGCNSTVIPNTVTSIGSSAFYNCSGLTSVTIPNSVTSIGNEAFSYCNGLTSVTIPNSVTSIGDFAFEGCSSLTSITIPNSVTSIGWGAFYNCSGLSSVTIGNSVTSIDDKAFWGCRGLTTIVVETGNTHYDSRDNCNAIIQTDFNLLIQGCNSTVIPNSVTSIGNYAFDSCSGLTSVTIPNSVTSIGNSAFSGCSGLTSVTIPSSVTSIGNWAFSGCSGLSSATIGNSVTSIGDYAFYNCSGLASVYCKPTTPPILSKRDFSSNCQIYVPCNSVSVYQSATNWSNYSSRIYGKPFDMGFTYTFLSSDDSKGTVIIGALDCDSNIIVNATANTGCRFLGWSDGGTGNPRTFHLTGDTTVTALFDYITYAVVGQSSDTARGTVEGSDTVFPGDTVALTAIPNYGYHFTRWSDYNEENPRKIAAIDNVSLTALFDFNQYTITLSADTAIHGMVTGSGTYNFLSECTISATANYGYHFTQWSDGETNNPRSITLTQDSMITAIFEPNRYVIMGIPSDIVYGLVTGSDTADYLDSVTLTAIPNYGYHFTHWSDNNEESPRKIAAIDNVSLTALFDFNQYTITLSTDTAIHGMVTGSGTYNFLSECAISATANYGYHFTQWNDGNTDNPRTVTMTKDTLFTAMFAPNQYAVTCTPSNSMYGLVTGSDTVDYLDTVILVATPYYGYRLSYWYRSGYYEYTQSDSLPVVANGNIEYVAYFTPIVYNVNALAEHGSIYVSGSRQYQTQVSLTANSNYGYHFTQWSDGNSDNPRLFTITKDTSFTALFERNEYTLSFQSEDSTMGIVNIVGIPGLYLDTTAYITATALPHYHFTHWNDGNTENPRRFVFDANQTYVASFAIDMHTVNVQVDHLAHGAVQGGGSFAYGSATSVSATPYSGYQFVHWSDGSIYNPYTFAVLEDKTLTAVFVAEGELWQDTVVLYDTTYVTQHDTMYINVFVHDTTYIDEPYPVHDTTIITDTVTQIEYVNVHDTTYVNVPYPVHDTTIVHDTAYVDVFVPVHDTTYVNIHDTTYINVPYPVHDTTIVHDTAYVDVFVTVHDTTYVNVHDTTYINVPYPVHDTTIVVDTLTVTQFDTIVNTVYDTIDNYIYDTLTVTDTLWLTQYDTIWMHDTIVVHDTIYITQEGIGDVDALNAKVYSSQGQIVVEGAGGNRVTLYDVSGRMLATMRDDYSALRFDVPASGTYLIKVGALPAKRVVVIR